MASGVNVKMGVTGVAQFKQNMNQAKNSLKTLDAQLALNEKQFKATGDAESYMTERSELLKAKLEQQKTVVSNAVIMRISVHATESGIAYLRNDFIHTEDGTIYIIIPHLKGFQHIIMLVQLPVHDLHPRTPLCILLLQNECFRRLQSEN